MKPSNSVCSRTRTLAVAVWLIAAAIGTQAAAQTRPRLTEEAGTARQGTLLLETGLDAMRAVPNFLHGRNRTRVDGPLLRLVFSPAENVELDLEWVSRVVALDDPVFGNVGDWGDVSLRSKVRLAGGHGSRSALSARYGLTLPQTKFARGLGPNTIRMSAQLLASTRLGDCELHVNAGLALHDEVLRPHQQRDFLAYGVALERRVGRRLTLVGDWAGLAGSGAPGAEKRSEARYGLIWARNGARWDLALRRGLTKADGTWGLTGGVVWTLRESARASGKSLAASAAERPVSRD